MVPFDLSRRLPGPSLLLDAPGVVLEVPVEYADPSAVQRWRTRVADMRQRLGWPAAAIVARLHSTGATLGFEAPPECLLAATEVNEWAWLGAIEIPEPWPTPRGPAQAVHDAAAALPLLRHLAVREPPPHFTELLSAAAALGVPTYWDDTEFTIGGGRWSRSWPLEALPAADAVEWDTLRGVPTALVSGSNGKTTTVRLLAAMCTAHGWHAGYSSTDGVCADGAALEDGDWAGPAGARVALRDARVEAAVLETARGGILRRGLAVTGARAAVITNIQLDHFGEYGIDDLSALAAVKMVVTKGLASDGVLVLNADDPHLVAAAIAWRGETAWFSLDAPSPVIAAACRAGTPCAVLRADGTLVLSAHGETFVLGQAAQLPLTVGGLAVYNVANALGAALAAWAMGISVATIAEVLARFGAARTDNPGRLTQWTVNGATVLLDYAHNPEGIAGLLSVARALCGPDGRLLVLLGQAGNRVDDAIRELARVVAAARPAAVVLKDMDGYMRGRAPGEVPAILADELRACGVPADAIETELDEVRAAQRLVGMARSGDVVVLPVHARAAREQVSAWLDALAAS